MLLLFLLGAAACAESGHEPEEPTAIQTHAQYDSDLQPSPAAGEPVPTGAWERPTVTSVDVESGERRLVVLAHVSRDAVVKLTVSPLRSDGKPARRHVKTVREEASGTGVLRLRITDIRPGRARWQVEVVRGGVEADRPLRGRVTVQAPPRPPVQATPVPTQPTPTSSHVPPPTTPPAPTQSPSPSKTSGDTDCPSCGVDGGIG